MAIGDNTSYELTGYQVKDLAQKIRSKADSSSLAPVATSGLYSDLTGAPTIPTVYNGTLTIEQNGATAGSFTANSSSNATISLTDTTYTHFTGATSSADGTQGLVPGPLTGDQDKVLHGDGTWKDATAKLVEMSYGESNAWAKFIAAYNAGSIVYCRASSNANPATGAQTRKAFMAYVNNEDNPTSVEFQYVRSVSSKTDSQQCDQVFVYTLTNASGGTWSVVSRNMASKINVNGPITKTFTTGANATVTIGADAMTGATSGAAGAAGVVPAPAAGDQDKVLTGAGTWASFLPVNVVTYSSSAQASNLSTTWSNLYSFDISAFPAGSQFIVIATTQLSVTGDASQFARVAYNGEYGYQSTISNVYWGHTHTLLGAFTKVAGVNTVYIQGSVSGNSNGAWGCQAFAMRIS